MLPFILAVDRYTRFYMTCTLRVQTATTVKHITTRHGKSLETFSNSTYPCPNILNDNTIAIRNLSPCNIDTIVIFIQHLIIYGISTGFLWQETFLTTSNHTNYFEIQYLRNHCELYKFANIMCVIILVQFTHNSINNTTSL